ncbi:Chromosome segregation ATPase [Petrocella atlantisensis]|uniref:Chromosome segregation ATPase n=1 Tax=Petrocella atlantisensis TaxID=2173034 RepID=A0A3P7PVM4_9FIRM|nr:hypothetical protein [Petrocella atlantisensis]VDN47261.1 Chromosome segregation ATPase [Petrocella atlantisensis]
MPKINRIRITNFSYNNNQRHIIDEIFDFYDGENALLSLANGGGKSVLVQTILQAIVPKTKLLGRSFSDFFIGKRDPAYIMIEWLLDDEAGFLLTGIGVSPSNNYNPNVDEENLNLRFYTFFHHYEDGNKYDIKHIPVTEGMNNGIVITGYNDFKKLIVNESNKGKYDISCYNSSKDEQKEYERKLNRYSISRNEWKELMVNINQAEHGVSEVFAQCRSSRQVMEQWIIKYIEKVLDKSSETNVSDHQKLEEMMIQVATAEVENETFIQEYESIEKFRIDLKTIEDEAKDICDLIDVEAEKKKELASTYHFFSNKMNEMADAEVQLKSDISHGKAEVEHIELEKKSYEIYLVEDAIKKSKEELECIQEQLEDVNSKMEKQQYEFNLQQGAREYEVIEEKLQEKAEKLQMMKNATKDQEELLKELNRIEYSLKCFYSHEIEAIDNEMKNFAIELKNFVTRKEELVKLTKQKNEQKSELNSDKGELKAKTEEFYRYEKKVYSELGINFNRNPLLNELNQDDIDKKIRDFNNEHSILESDYTNCKENLEQSYKQTEIVKVNQSSLNMKLMNIKEERSTNENLINQYEEKKNAIRTIISTYCQNEGSVFDQVTILTRLRKQYAQWNQKAITSEMEINEISKMINGLKEGISYLPTTLIHLLKNNDLDIFTGEQYLRELSSADREKIISLNSLLPYGLIVTEKERQIIEELTENKDISQLIPLFSHSDKETRIELGGNQILSNPSLLKYDEDALRAHIDKIEKQKEQLAVEKSAAVKSAECYLSLINSVESFKFTKEYEKELYYIRDEIANKIEKNVIEQEECQNLMNQLTQDIDVLKEKQQQIETGINKWKVNINLLNEYIEKNKQFVKELESLNQIMSLIETIDKGIKKLSDELILVEKMINDVNVKHSLKDVNLKDVKKKYELYQNSVEDVIINEMESELEGRLKACKAKITDNVEQINEQLQKIQKDIDRSNHNLERYGLNFADVRDIRYSEIIEKELHNQIIELKREKEKQDKTSNEIDKKISGFDAVKNEKYKRLNGSTIIDKSEIKGDFDERQLKLNKHIDLLIIEVDLLLSKKSLLSNMNTLIGAKVDNISKIQYNSEVSIQIDENTESKIRELISQFIGATIKTSRLIGDFEKTCKKVKDSYLDIVAGTVQEAIKGIYTQIDNLERSYDKYYYLTERIAFYDELLGNTMKLMQTKIDQLVHSKNDLIEHAYLEAKNVYDEIPKVVDNSSIEIDGAKKKILDIQYDKIQSDEIAKERIKDHILICLDSITHEIKNNEDESRIRKNVIKILSTKELLNIISNLENFKVKAYKVDINEKNRKMMSWEDLIVKNSGGEKFVAYFSLLVALISYSRKNTHNIDLFKKKEESKVLIMDNPFGPITSGHLLKPMFDIAKKYNTQLICLSDIKEGAVINSFNLVYNIKIRQNMMRQEYLDIEENNFADLKTNEKLEKAYLYSKSTQMSLLDE